MNVTRVTDGTRATRRQDDRCLRHLDARNGKRNKSQEAPGAFSFKYWSLAKTSSSSLAGLHGFGRVELSVSNVSRALLLAPVVFPPLPSALPYSLSHCIPTSPDHFVSSSDPLFPCSAFLVFFSYFPQCVTVFVRFALDEADGGWWRALLWLWMPFYLWVSKFVSSSLFFFVRSGFVL